MKREMNYKEAFDELQQIVSELETGNIGIDELSDKVKRAAQLVTFCRKKLMATELDVQQILQELDRLDNNKETDQPTDKTV